MDKMLSFFPLYAPQMLLQSYHQIKWPNLIVSLWIWSLEFLTSLTFTVLHNLLPSTPFTSSDEMATCVCVYIYIYVYKKLIIWFSIYFKMFFKFCVNWIVFSFLFINSCMVYNLKFKKKSWNLIILWWNSYWYPIILILWKHK